MESVTAPMFGRIIISLKHIWSCVKHALIDYVRCVQKQLEFQTFVGRCRTFATSRSGRSGVSGIECFTFSADGLNQQNSYLTKGRQSANNTLVSSSCGMQSVKSEEYFSSKMNCYINPHSLSCTVLEAEKYCTSV